MILMLLGNLLHYFLVYFSLGWPMTGRKGNFFFLVLLGYPVYNALQLCT